MSSDHARLYVSAPWMEKDIPIELLTALSLMAIWQSRDLIKRVSGKETSRWRLDDSASEGASRAGVSE